MGAIARSFITHAVGLGASSNVATNRRSRAPLTNCRIASTSSAAMMTSGSCGSGAIARARVGRLFDLADLEVRTTTDGALGPVVREDIVVLAFRPAVTGANRVGLG